RQIADELRAVKRVLGYWRELDGPLRFADRLFFSAKPGIKSCDQREVVRILGLIAPCRVQVIARGCKHRQRILLIAARARNLSISPTRIRPTRRNSSTHPIRRFVISQVKRCLESDVPNPCARTILQWHLIKKRLSRDRIALRQLRRR